MRIVVALLALVLAGPVNADTADEPQITQSIYTAPFETSTCTASSSTACEHDAIFDACPSGITYPGACDLPPSTPDGLTCDKRGILSSSEEFGSVGGWSITYNGMPQNRIEDCALICNMCSFCESFGYKSSDIATPCRFSSKSLTDSGFAEDSYSVTFWYDMGCATCIECGATPGSLMIGTPPSGHGCTRKKGVEDQYSCDRDGTPGAGLRLYSELIYSANPSSADCAALCARQQGCRASAYDPSGGLPECFYSGYSLKDSNFLQGSGNQVWNDRECWTCAA